MSNFLTRIILVFTLVYSASGWTQTRYVTDQFEITMRSGASTSNNILSMLKSGQAVKVLEQDNATKYSLVETSTGKQGYVLTRFLDDEPSGRERLQKLQALSADQRQKIADLSTRLQQYRAGKSSDEAMIQELQTSLDGTRDELTELQESTRDTVRILKQNEGLQLRINELDTNIQRLTAENARYKDQTAMDWFIRGAAVSLIAFLLGILITRVRWKKRDSWGSY